ncbi:MAG: flagellar basal-body rod protein FlgF [Pirellulales bacterium]
MPYGLYISAEGAQAQSRRLEVVANNLANVDTVGFRRDVAQFQARFAEEIESGRDHYGSGSVNNLGGGVQVQSTATDFTAGSLKRTGTDTDLAIRGDGFFVIRKGDDQLLTRAGNFLLSPTGQLETGEGYPVMNDTGNPVVIDQDLGPWMVTPDGGIAQAGNVTYLAMVRPDSLADLVKQGENMFHSTTAPQPVEPSQRAVAQGWLETSGVKPTSEMMQMIEASRAFEANVNMIRNQDQMLGTLITRILRTA